MTSPHRWRKVESALGAAPAHSLPEALTAAVLTELPQASSLRLLLADYQRRILLPVDDGVPAKPVQVNGTPAGRAFTSLRPVPTPAIVGTAGERRLYTPVTARGERLGVLEIRLTAEPGGVIGEPLITELARLGEIVGCALKLAWTFTDRYERAVSVVDAGSPRILRMRGTRVEHIELDHQMPLGMFPDTRYQVERFRLEAGDRLIVVSDGVSDARSPDGDAFGAVLLERALQRVRPLDASQVPFSIIKALLDHRQAADLDDDAVAVCLDWN